MFLVCSLCVSLGYYCVVLYVCLMCDYLLTYLRPILAATDVARHGMTSDERKTDVFTE